MRAILGFLALLTPFVASAPAAATPYACSEPVSVGGVAYVVADEVLGDKYLFSIWGFLETNGQPGLQRPSSGIFGGADPCATCFANCDMPFF